MSMCRVVSCVVGRECLLWPVCSLDKSLLAFALFHFVLQSQTCLLLQISSDLLFCIPIPHDEKDIFTSGFVGFFLLLLVLESLVGVYRTVSFSFFGISGWRMFGKSLQLCQTIFDPMDCNLLDSSVHGILQARVLESGAIAFSNDLL